MKKTITVIIAAVFIMLLFTVTAAAENKTDDTGLYAATFGKVGDKLVVPGGSELSDTAPTAIEGARGVTSVNDGKYYTFDFSDNTEEAIIKYSADTLSDSVSLGIFIESEGASPVGVTMEVAGETKVYSCYSEIIPGKPYIFAADTSAVNKGIKLSAVRVIFSFAEGEAPERASVSHLAKSDVNFGFQKKNKITSLSVLEGSGDEKADSVALTPSEDGKCRVKMFTEDTDIYSAVGKTVKEKNDGFEGGSIYYCLVEASTENGGIVSCDGNNRTLTMDGNMVYIKSENCEGDGINLSFEGTGKLTLTRAAAYNTGCGSDKSYPVTVKAMTVDEKDNLTVECKLRDGNTDLLDGGEMKLYMADFSGDNSVLLDTVKAASRFTFSVSLKAYPGYSAEKVFYITAAKGDGETKATAPSFISESRTTADSAQTSVFGIHGCDPVRVYDIGASYVVEDIYLDRLVKTEGSGSSVSHGGNSFSLNNEYLSEIDKNMRLYKAAGSFVSFRLIISTPMKWKDNTVLTVGRGGKYIPNISNKAAVDYILGSVSYLCSRYPGISSLMISEDITGCIGKNTDVTEFAEGTAMLMRLIYSVASEKIPGIYLVLPIDERDDNYSLWEPIAITVSEKMASLGNIPWTVMNITENPSPKFSDNVYSATKATSGTMAYSGIIMWRPNITEGIAEEYARICEECYGSVRAVILSIGDFSISENDYTRLRETVKKNGIVFSSTSVAPSSSYSFKNGDRQVLWNFSSSYSTLGWFVGSGISDFGTSSDTNRTRALRFTVEDGDYTDSGVVLCTFDDIFDLSRWDAVEFTYTAECATSFDMVIVFSGATGRTEYRIQNAGSVKDGDGVCRVVCDLNEFIEKNDIRSVGIILYSEDEVSFSLMGADAVGSLYQITEEEEATEPPESLMKKQIIIIGCAAVASVTVAFAVVAGKADKRRKAERKHGRVRKY